MDNTDKLALMMIRCGLATGHGNTFDDLVFELKKQINNTLRAFNDARKEIERLQGDVKFASECSKGAYADVEILKDKIRQLRKVFLTVLEACKDVNSPDRKVREEITRTVRKVLKEKA